MDKELEAKIKEVIELAKEKDNPGILSIMYATLGAGYMKSELILAHHIGKFLEEVLKPMAEKGLAENQARKN